MIPLPRSIVLLLTISTWLLIAPSSPAQEPPQQDDPATSPELTRTLFVPFEDLQVLLEGQTERVFMTRDEYRALKKKAAANEQPQLKPPHACVLLKSRFEGRIEQTYAYLNGTIDIDVLSPGLHEINLPMQGVRLLSAQLDDAGAPMIRNAAGQRQQAFANPPLKYGTQGSQ